MNESTPLEPPSAAGGGPIPFIDGHALSQPAESAAHAAGAAEPGRSFFRGAAVGLGIMIPIWAWVAIWLLR